MDAENNLSSAELPRKAPPVSPVWPGVYNRQRPVKKRLLLPESARHPLAVLAICVLPQIILLAINFSAWQLGSAEMTTSEALAAKQIFITQLIALGAGAGLSGWLFARKQLLKRWQGLITLLPSLAFLATVFILAQRAIPAAVADWMLPPEQWTLKQFALAMPAVLYGALRLLCPDSENDREIYLIDQSIALAVALAGLSIGSLFFIIFVLSAIPYSFHNVAIAQITLVFTFMLMSTLAAAALLRASMSAYIKARASSPGTLAALTLLIALAGPIFGLLLNATTPFPADFQSPAIYIAAVVNGLVLLLPNFSQPILHRIVWIAQCAMFPFTAYFFAVFLPFVLVAPLGLMAMGLGLLIYVPSLLFLLHGYRIIDGYHAEVRDGSKRIPAIIGTCAILVWPVAYTMQARWDRASLHEALDYLQYPNYAQNAHFGGSRFALRSSLENLRDFKEGLYLPFLSEYYNWLAFDGMVLPQSKLNDLGETFFGQPLGKSTRRSTFSEFGLGRTGARNMTEAINGVQGERPSANARLQTVQTSVTREQGVNRGRATLTVLNPAGGATEYLATLYIPPGVMISNMWLTIGTERVPGRIFEKRAAMWVYQKITEVRPIPRDPAILRYTGPNSAELRVYPVESGSPRVVEVEFLYADGTHPAIRRSGHGELMFSEDQSVKPAIGVSEDGSFMATIPASPSLPQVQREPYLHFLVDMSKGSAYARPDRLRTSLESIAKSYPKTTPARLTFVNFETREAFGGRTVSLEQLLSAPDTELSSPAQGGLLASRAIKEVLWQNHLLLSSGNAEALSQFPQIMLLKGSALANRPEESARLEEFARLAPDLPGYWAHNFADATSEFVPFVSLHTQSEKSPVHIFQVGGLRFASPAGKAAAWVSTTSPPSTPSQIEAFDPAGGKFISVGSVDQPSNPAYGEAIAPWSLEMRRLFEPWKQKKEALGDLLALCRATGILVPSAAYMVVENTAQWKMLERAEKKATKGHEGLAMQETVPEPSTLLLVITGAAALLGARRRRA